MHCQKVCRYWCGSCFIYAQVLNFTRLFHALLNDQITFIHGKQETQSPTILVRRIIMGTYYQCPSKELSQICLLKCHPMWIACYGSYTDATVANIRISCTILFRHFVNSTILTYVSVHRI